MIRRLRLALVILAVVFLQTAVFPSLRVGGAAPELGVVAAAALAYYRGPEEGAVFGFVTGLAVDLFLETPLGLSALCYALVAYVVGLVQGSLVRTAWWMPPVLGGLAGLAGGALFVGIGALVGQEHLWTAESVRLVVISAAYDAVLAPVVFVVVRAASRDVSLRR